MTDPPVIQSMNEQSTECDEDAIRRIQELLHGLDHLFGPIANSLLQAEPRSPTQSRKPSKLHRGLPSVEHSQAPSFQTTYLVPLAEPAESTPVADPSSVRLTDEELMEISAMADDDVPEKSPNSVHFSEIVSVVNIPSVNDLSPKRRRLLWSNFDEIQENSDRNVREFEYDGFQWMDATEEEDMHYDPVSGQLFHPATWKDVERDIHHVQKREMHHHHLKKIHQRRIRADQSKRLRRVDLSFSKQVPSTTSRGFGRAGACLGVSPQRRRSPGGMPSLTRFSDT